MNRLPRLFLYFAALLAARLMAAPVLPIVAPDSHVYLSESRQSYAALFGAAWGAPTWRPPGYPLVLKLLGADAADASAATVRATWLQAAVGALAAWCLYLALAQRCLRTERSRTILAVLMIAWCATWPVAPWDAGILTESLSVSAFALMTALLVCMSIAGTDAVSGAGAESPANVAAGAVEEGGGDAPGRAAEMAHIWAITWFVPVAAFFLWLRDAHIPIMLCVIAALALRAMSNWRKRHPVKRVASILPPFILIVLAVAQWRASIASGRADWPLTNVLSRRVLSAPDRFELFVAEHGLPAQVRPMVGEFVWQSWRHEPAYIGWLADGGRFAYARFLLEHPGYVVNESSAALTFAAGDAGGQSLDAYFVPEEHRTLRAGFVSVVTAVFTAPLRFSSRLAGAAFTWALVGGLGVLAVLILRREARNGAATAAMLSAAAALAQALSTRFFDACEDSRHNLLAYAVLGLAFWMSLLVIVDDVLARREAR